MQKISRIYRFIIIICAGFILVRSESMVEGFEYLDYVSIIYMILICLVVYIASLERFVAFSPLNNVVTFILVLYLIGRLAVLSVYPDSLLGYRSYTSVMYNRTLFFILFGTMTCYLGLVIGFYKNKGKQNLLANSIKMAGSNSIGEKRFARHLLLLSNLTICFLLFSIFVHYTYGYPGSTGSGAHLPFFRRYVARFIDARMMLFLTTVYYYSQKIDIINNCNWKFYWKTINGLHE